MLNNTRLIPGALAGVDSELNDSPVALLEGFTDVDDTLESPRGLLVYDMYVRWVYVTRKPVGVDSQSNRCAFLPP